MRMDVAHAEGGRAAPVPAPAPAQIPAPRPRRRLDRFELGTLSVFALLSLWVLGLDVYQVLAHGRVWTGTDGLYVVDQMQYLAWIKSASLHGLASNMFVLRGTAADYFQPAIAISAALTAVGVAPWLALLLWKPVAVVGAFLAVRAYARRHFIAVWPRRAALVLGLFFGSITVIYGSPGVLGDTSLSFLSWGYSFALLALACMLFALLAYDRSLRSGRSLWAAGLLGALASLLHPWQGELLILIVAGTEAVRLLQRRQRGQLRVTPDGPPGDGRRRVLLAVLTVGLTALPLLYYLILGRLDLSWALARGVSKHAFSVWTILLALAPLAIPAAFAYRLRTRSFLGLATRIWPVGALVVFILSGTGLSATPLHASEGITVPLAVLAVQAVMRTGPRGLRHRGLIAAALVTAATLPAIVWALNSSRAMVAPSEGNANFITPSERAALNFLAHDPQPGGVLTRFYLGTVVPAETGRQTVVGNCLWSQPRCAIRAQRTQSLLQGSEGAAAAQRFVSRTHARFILSDCQAQADLTPLLKGVVQSVRHFGCATVYTVE